MFRLCDPDAPRRGIRTWRAIRGPDSVDFQTGCDTVQSNRWPHGGLRGDQRETPASDGVERVRV